MTCNSVHSSFSFQRVILHVDLYFHLTDKTYFKDNFAILRRIYLSFSDKLLHRVLWSVGHHAVSKQGNL